MKKTVKVVVLSQDDSFVIPKNIRLVSEIENIELLAVVNIKHRGSLGNKKSLFLKGFGFFQVAKLGLLAVFNRFLDFVDYLFLYRFKFCKSLKSVASISDAKYIKIKDPNEKQFQDWLIQQNVGLIVSFSAPCIFADDLLEIPSLGCINLHCSLLPKFPGLLPSFWALFEGEEKLGATVHAMDNKIDNGDILGQVIVELPNRPSMFSVINATKAAGGLLMVETIKNLLSDKLEVKVNRVSEKDYYTWPTIEQIKAFRRNGGRLI